MRLSAVPVERLRMYVGKIVCQTSLLFLLTWVSLAIFCSDQWLTEIVCSAQHQLSLVRRKLNGAYELRVIAAVELHVNATYYAQHQTLKSVNGKSQSVIVGKLFSSSGTIFELAQGLLDSKTSD